MRNILGDNLTLTLFGESHGPAIGAVLDGMQAGIKVDVDFIKLMLSKRRPQKDIETNRVEMDEFEIISGVFNGFTTAAPLTILIKNKNVISKDYSELKNVMRPSHADYTANIKYHGYNDYRGGGHFSGRITVAIVAVGSILIQALRDKGIYIGTHIKKCGNVTDKDFSIDGTEVKDLINKEFPVLNNIEEDIKNVIKTAKENNDSVGGILQTAIVGLPVGLGTEWFSSVEGKLANACFSIGGVKGIEFGLGFDFSNQFGSTSNDQLYVEDNVVKTRTNNNGGINGGLTNGMPVVFNLAVKPTPSIKLKQQTINIETMDNTTLELNGRHDPAIIRRMAVVIDAVVAVVVCDLLKEKYGENFLK